MSIMEFRLPDVGEGLTEADVVAWHVAPGDVVAVNDIVVEIETAKSVVELPSPYAGRVGELVAAEGESVPVGGVLFTVRGESQREPQTASAAPESAAADPAPPVLVGYGPSAGGPRRKRRAARGPAEGAPAHTTAGEPDRRVLSTPPVRKLARDLGIHLGDVPPATPGARITRADVLRYAETAAAAGAGVVPDEPGVPGRDDETRVPIRGVRKQTAAAVSASARTAPHVTEFLTVDVSKTVEYLRLLGSDRRFEGVKVTPLLIAARAVCVAVGEHPQINSRWDEEAGEIVIKRAVNLGIATATERGLLVPNIKNADAMALPELARSLGELVRLARAGQTKPRDTTGGTITITNIGVFGIDAATPILNPGEAAILCLGAVRRTPWLDGDEIVPRWTVQLSLSFDHRLIDGELGSRFLRRVGEVLHDPTWELPLA